MESLMEVLGVSMVIDARLLRDLIRRSGRVRGARRAFLARNAFSHLSCTTSIRRSLRPPRSSYRITNVLSRGRVLEHIWQSLCFLKSFL